MVATGILNFQIRKILLANGTWWRHSITVPNFVTVGQSVAEILLFFKFSRWQMPPF